MKKEDLIPIIEQTLTARESLFKDYLEATGIDLGKKLLRTDDAEIPYDNLILARRRSQLSGAGRSLF